MFYKSSNEAAVQESRSYSPSVPGLCPVSEAIDLLATAGGVEERGAIYTKVEVVDFMLDVIGYKSGQPLHKYRLLEPSFGGGEFLLSAVNRLLQSAVHHEVELTEAVLGPCVRAVELHHESFNATHEKLFGLLLGRGVAPDDAEKVLELWLRQGDFLLTDFSQTFTHVVGNPPYVRQESVPDVLMREYRLRYKTIFDRADLYVPFIERSLDLLTENGRVSFICADRWMKNRYGQRLREKVRANFGLEMFVDMVGTDAFHEEVSAYPAITVIRRGPSPETRVAAQPEISSKALGRLAIELTKENPSPQKGVTVVPHAIQHDGPWVLNTSAELALARRLQDMFPALEDAGCKVGIGVATGADSAFIGEYADLDVEASRKLPLVMTKDLVDGEVSWRGYGVINPFGEDGKLVPLAQFPRLERYLEERKDVIARRHVATKAPKNWYRTIDRIYPELAARPKLLVPDIRGDAAFVIERGKLYPHHNLYYVVSNDWDLNALQMVMQSGVAKLFVSLYSTKMRGGYLRFQAQYLRRIHLPHWETLEASFQNDLVKASELNDRAAQSGLIQKLYGLSDREMCVLNKLNTAYA